MYNYGTVLVLAPHTDDGEFGCGGTIRYLLERGSRVIYVAFSAAEDFTRRGYTSCKWCLGCSKRRYYCL